jgi:hypothetical protein
VVVVRLSVNWNININQKIIITLSLLDVRLGLFELFGFGSSTFIDLLFGIDLKL